MYSKFLYFIPIPSPSLMGSGKMGKITIKNFAIKTLVVDFFSLKTRLL